MPFEFILDVDWMRWLIATVVLGLLLLSFALLLAKWRQVQVGAGLSDVVQLVSRKSLSPRHEVLIFQVGGTTYTILAGPQGDQLLRVTETKDQTDA